MLSLKLSCRVPENRTVIVKLPDEVQPGEHELVVVIDQAIAPPERRRKPGSAKGKLIVVAEDESHLEDFKEYMP